MIFLDPVSLFVPVYQPKILISRGLHPCCGGIPFAQSKLAAILLWASKPQQLILKLWMAGQSSYLVCRKKWDFKSLKEIFSHHPFFLHIQSINFHPRVEPLPTRYIGENMQENNKNLTKTMETHPRLAYLLSIAAALLHFFLSPGLHNKFWFLASQEWEMSFCGCRGHSLSCRYVFLVDLFQLIVIFLDSHSNAFLAPRQKIVLVFPTWTATTTLSSCWTYKNRAEECCREEIETPAIDCGEVPDSATISLLSHLLLNLDEIHPKTGKSFPFRTNLKITSQKISFLI